MTAATSLFQIPVIPVPVPNEHPERVQDIIALWNLAKNHDLQEKAQELMKKYPGAREMAERSLPLQQELRELLNQPQASSLPITQDPFDMAEAATPEVPQPAPLQFTPATPAQAAVPAQPVPALTPVNEELPAPPEEMVDEAAEDTPTEDSPEEEVEESEEAPEEADAEETDDDDEPDTEDPESQPSTNTIPTPAPVKKVSAGDPTWKDGLLGEGLISQLARTLSHKESVSIILSRNGDELCATIIPSKGEGEDQATVIPLNVTGSPRELDTELAQAMPSYQGARKTARELAQELLEKTQKAAEAARTKAKAAPATAKKGSTPTPAQATVTITAEGNPGALIHLESESGGKITATSGKPVKVGAGTYTLHAVANLMEPYKEKLTVKAGETKAVSIKLQAQGVPALF